VQVEMDGERHIRFEAEVVLAAVQTVTTLKAHPVPRELQVPSVPAYSTHAWHLYMLRLRLERLGIDRAAFVERLRERKIGVSVHFIPLHVHPYYRDTYGYAPEDFPVAYSEYLREISLPVYSTMSDDDVESVIAAVADIVAANRR